MIRAILGDITKLTVDVIVNAANARLAGGGGVDGAIHSAAGPSVMAELDTVARTVAPVKPGSVVVTLAGRLDAKWIFHAVGPIWTPGCVGQEAELRECYYQSLWLARKMKAATIAFPAISTGVYRFPKQLAAEIAVSEVRKSAGPLDVSFVLFDNESFSIYESLLALEGL